jgi:hypothetical protein
LVEIGLEHLLDVCPSCRQEVEAFRRKIGRQRSGADPGVVSAVLDAQVKWLEKEHRRAERDLRDLLAMPEEERAGRINVHREAIAALVLFQEAVRKEHLTTAFIRELVAYLDMARNDPSIRFRGGPER